MSGEGGRTTECFCGCGQNSSSRLDSVCCQWCTSMTVEQEADSVCVQTRTACIVVCDKSGV